MAVGLKTVVETRKCKQMCCHSVQQIRWLLSCNRQIKEGEEHEDEGLEEQIGALIDEEDAENRNTNQVEEREQVDEQGADKDVDGESIGERQTVKEGREQFYKEEHHQESVIDRQKQIEVEGHKEEPVCH